MGYIMKKVIYAISLVFLLVNVCGWSPFDNAMDNEANNKVPEIEQKANITQVCVLWNPLDLFRDAVSTEVKKEVDKVIPEIEKKFQEDVDKNKKEAQDKIEEAKRQIEEAQANDYKIKRDREDQKSSQIKSLLLTVVLLVIIGLVLKMIIKRLMRR